MFKIAPGKKTVERACVFVRRGTGCRFEAAVVALAEELGIPRKTVKGRIAQDLPINRGERTMTTRNRLGLLGVVLLTVPLAAQEPVQLLQERFQTGQRYQVRLRVELSAQMTVPATKNRPAQTIKQVGSSDLDYQERILELDRDGRVSRTLRWCSRMHFRRTTAGQEQELALRPAVRRLVILRKGHTEVPFSPDGPLTWGELDAVRTDVFLPGLTGLLSGKESRVGDRWLAATSALQELTDLDKIDRGELECRFDRLEQVAGRAVARVTFTGTVSGVGEDGKVEHRLRGYLLFDRQGGYLSELTLLGSAVLLDKDNREVGQIDGRLVLQRRAGGDAEGLQDGALRGLKTEPDAENTALLYDNTRMGVRFVYPRHWKVAQEMGSQVALDTPEGNSVLVTIDPPQSVPTAAAFLDESRNWLIKQKGKVVQVYSPRRLRDRPALDGFALEVELGGQRLWLDYYVVTQPIGGATIAGRLLPEDLATVRKEVDRIARSVEITRPIKAGK